MTMCNVQRTDVGRGRPGTSPAATTLLQYEEQSTSPDELLTFHRTELLFPTKLNLSRI